MKEIKLTEDMEGLLIEFDEHGFAPTVTMPNAEEYAKAWRNSLVDLFERMQAEKEWLKEELKIEKHNHKATQWHFDNSYKEGVRLLEENKELQKQVDELTKEYERLSDLEFTQEHCDLYQENEYLKECLILAKKQAVKDTAKEILQSVDNESNGQTVSVTNVLRKRYGVEVE